MKEKKLERKPVKKAPVRLGWEEKIKVGRGFSSYLLGEERVTGSELVKRAFSLAKSFVTSMDTGGKSVLLSFTNKEGSDALGKTSRSAPGSCAFRKDNSFKISLDTEVFMERELSEEEQLDVFIGLAIHETCHVLYTDFHKLREFMIYAERFSKFPLLIHGILNVLEDERIEQLSKEKYPGLYNFIDSTHDLYFVRYHKPITVGDFSSVSGHKWTEIEKVMQLFTLLVRKPEMISMEDAESYADLIDEFMAVLSTPATSMDSVLDRAIVIYKIIRRYAEKKEKEEKEEKEKEKGGSGKGKGKGKGDKAGKSRDSEDGSEEGSEDGSGDEDEDEDEELEDGGESGEEDMEVPEGGDYKDPKSFKLKVKEEDSKVSDISKEMYDELLKVLESTSERDAIEMIMDSKTKEEIVSTFTGEIEVYPKESYFFNMKDDKVKYMEYARKVNQFASSLSRMLTFEHRDEKLVLKSMRSGVLDTNKLAEAVQGVATIYERHGTVKSDKASVILLIDQSGSMGGYSIERAVQCAVLFKEALAKVPDVTLYIYGHTGDMTSSRSTDLYVYQEPGVSNPFSLGNCRALSQNRDGTAIRSVVDRVRKKTDQKMVMFMIADGEPAASGYGGGSAIADVRAAVQYAERKGIEIINISIDSSYDPATMYKHYVKFTDLAKLVTDMGGLMRKVVKKLISAKTTF